MPWMEVTRVSLREEFVQLAVQPGVNWRELCRRFGFTPKTGFKWLAYYAAAEPSSLDDRSQRPGGRIEYVSPRAVRFFLCAAVSH
jgi:transposase-like protein